MVINKLTLIFIIFSFGICTSYAQKLRNIKHFNSEVLNNIDTENYYECIGVYFADKNYNIIEVLNNTSTRILKFEKNGYILSSGDSNNKDGYRGVLYLKRKKIKIDLIDGTSDRSRYIQPYNVKIEGNKIHLLQQPFIINDPLLYLIYELKKK